MSFDTYANLQLEIISWLHRADLTAKVPGFIALAEAAINRKLNIVPKEIDVSLVTVVGSRYVAKSAGLSEPIAIWNEYTQPRDRLTAVPPEQMTVNTFVNGAPSYWAIDGSNIAFDKKADLAYPLTFRYVKDGALSDANPTSELLTRAPDLYLYGALSQAQKYMKDDKRAAVWVGEFKEILRAVHAEYSRTKSVAPLMTELPVSLLNSRINRRY